MIVVDVNIISSYFIAGPQTPATNSLRAMDPEWLVPSFWCVEFQSILWKYIRFGGMPAEKGLELLDQAISLFSENDITPPSDVVLRDALAWGITVYDAQYVSLAKQFRVCCVTDDVQVQKACPGIACSLDHFIHPPSRGGVVRESKCEYHVRRRKKSSG